RGDASCRRDPHPPRSVTSSGRNSAPAAERRSAPAILVYHRDPLLRGVRPQVLDLAGPRIHLDREGDPASARQIATALMVEGDGRFLDHTGSAKGEAGMFRIDLLAGVREPESRRSARARGPGPQTASPRRAPTH